MKRIERYVAAQLLRPIFGVFSVVLLVMLAYYFSSYLADAVIDRLSIGAVVTLATLKLGLFFDVLIPAAIFLGTITGLGRLQSGYEMTAIAASGVGRARIVRAVLAIALLGVLLVAAITHVFRPWAYETLYRMEGELVARVDLSRVEPGRFEIGDEEWMIFAEARDGSVLYDVLVHQRTPTYRNLLRAEQLAQRDGADGSIALEFSGDVRSYRLQQGGDADLVGRSERLVVQFDPPEPVEPSRKRRELGLTELMAGGGALEWGELQWRTLMPLSVVVLAGLALAVARINPRHGQTSRVILATVLVTLYFAAVGTLANRVDAATMPIWPGLFWAPLGTLVFVGLRLWRNWRGPGAPL
ncbi:LptF/LptG family permease [Halomonas denitrificans]|nr:LptF/LptG family permease [Halomonas denitrificans]